MHRSKYWNYMFNGYFILKKIWLLLIKMVSVPQFENHWWKLCMKRNETYNESIQCQFLMKPYTWRKSMCEIHPQPFVNCAEAHMDTSFLQLLPLSASSHSFLHPLTSSSSNCPSIHPLTCCTVPRCLDKAASHEGISANSCNNVRPRKAFLASVTVKESSQPWRYDKLGEVYKSCLTLCNLQNIVWLVHVALLCN